MTGLRVVVSGPVDQVLANLKAKAAGYVEKSAAANTKKAYMKDWKEFSRWCAAMGLQAMPASAETLSLYLTDCADRHKVSTMERRLSAISRIHTLAKHPLNLKEEPLLSTWNGIKRDKGRAKRQVAPATIEEIRKLMEVLPENRKGIRDRALLLVGFAGALRREEIVSIDWEHLTRTKDGYILLLPKSKTDQEREGVKLGIPYGSNPETCPVRALEALQDDTGFETGPVFRGMDRWGNISAYRLGDNKIPDIIKEYVEAAKLDPALFSGHSLRAGFITSAADNEVPEHEIQPHSRHKSIRVLRGYIRNANLFKRNPASRVGL